MLKTKDGQAKVIGTSYQGSSDYLLLSNGDSKAISSLSVNYATSAGNADTLDNYHANGLFTAFGNDENNISATIGTVTKKFEVKYSHHSYYSRFIKGEDQRNANNAPNYYMNTFGDASLCTEFSQQGKQFGNGTYVNLITSTPWRDSGGGRPTQLAIGNYIGLRSATNDSTWGAWRTIPTIDANGVMEIGKFIDWHWNNEIYGSQDFSTRLQAQNTSSYPNTVYLPTQSGELALLDQVELSQYHVVDMRNYDSGYWHPVTVGLPRRGYNKIKVSVELDIGDKPSWATHDSGFTCNMEIWATAHGWGTTNAETICLNYTYGHCNSNPCGWKQLGYPSLGVLFLRGGSRYKVWTDFDATFTPHDKIYTWTEEGYTQSTGGPYTSCPGLDFIKNRIYANLEGSAYYLEGGNIPSWGTLTAANGFTNVSSYDYGSRGAYGLCGKNTALYMQLDGYFYQNEGKYRVIDTSDFNWTNLPGKVVAGNEFNIVNAGYSDTLAINYLPINNRNSSANISTYIMYNGNRGLASVYAYRFKAEGKSCMWKDARNYAPFYSTYNGGFEPILDIKTVSGDWSIGSYDSAGNYLIFSFTSDSDFNAGVNGTAWYYITTDGTFSGASRYINHTPGDPQSYMHSTSTGTYGGAIQIREVNEVLNNQSAWGYAPRITFHWGQRYAKGFGMRSDGQFAVDDVPIALTSNVLTFSNESTDYLSANFNNPDFSKKAASKYIECWDGSGGWWNWMAGKFMKAGSSDAYVLLGGGGHKPLSEFQLGNGSYLPYNGWWASGSGQDINDANGMIFAYATHKNTPFSSAWGIITTFDYTYNSAYKFQLAANGYSNAMYYRSRSTDRGGWTSWAQVIDTGNISSQRVAYATSAGSVAWANVTGKPTIPNPTNYYWANIKVSASSNTQTQPSVNTIYANNWFRSQGNCGWFSESYGGGIYMVDTSWIRTYNGKGFYCDNQIYSSDSIRMNSIYLHHYNEINNVDNGKLHLNYRNTGNVTICNGGGAVTIGSTTDDIGGNKLYVNGSEFIDGVSNVRNHVFADGFRHRSHNSNDSVLLAGGGYSQGVPVRYWAIYQIYIGGGPNDASYTKRSGNHDFITSYNWQSEGIVTLQINFPPGYNKTNTLIFGNGDHQISHNWTTPVYVTIITDRIFGSESQIRVLLSNDSSLDTGYANIYFMCMG